MSKIQEVAQQLGGIIEPEGPLPIAQGSLEDATVHLFEGWNTLHDTLYGNSDPEAQAVVVQMAEALAKVSGAQKMLLTAARGIMRVRGKVLGMPDEVQPTRVQFSREHDGRVYMRRHPEPDVQARIDRAYAERVESNEKIKDAIDAAPNLNEEFKSEIEKAEAELRNLGLSTLPVVVLAGEKFREVAGDTGVDPEAMMGHNIAGRTVINGDTTNPNLEPDAKKRLVFDTLVHEMGHSSGYNPHIFVHTHMVAEDDRRFVASNALGGFHKVKISEELTRKGLCLEEGFMELTASKVGEQVGTRATYTIGENVVIDGMIHTDEQPTTLPRLDDNPIELPATFWTSTEADEEGSFRLFSPMSAPIAYGIHLMDQQRPGLYDDMVAARSDPKRQADYIRKIESIKPGLYKELRDLEYCDEGAVQALRIIGQAISDQQ